MTIVLSMLLGICRAFSQPSSRIPVYIVPENTFEISDSLFLQKAYTIPFRIAQSSLDFGQLNVEQFWYDMDHGFSNELFNDAQLIVRSSSSPDGKYWYNEMLTKKRHQSVLDWVKEHDIKFKSINARYVPEDYELLLHLMNQADDPDTETVRAIVESGKTLALIKKKLQEYNGGELWQRLFDTYYADARSARIMIVMQKEKYLLLSHDFPEMASVIQPEYMPPLPDSLPEVQIPVSAPQPPTQQDTTQQDTTQQDTTQQDTTLTESKYLFALKTNMLLDAASVLNIGAELPLGSRWSISASMYFPWWKLPRKDITVQLLAGTLEGRYWFGDRQTRPVLTGWFAGLSAGAGLYDFQMGSKGVQGEMFILSSANFGYAHTLRKQPSLRLEYSLGLGFIMTDYRPYNTIHDPRYGTIKARPYPWEDHRFTGLLPTNASVSLVWLINHKTKKKSHE